MMRKVAIIAMTVGASVASDFAHAGCSGTACSALSPGATYSSSDKRVNVSLTNKDSNQSVHVKFCVTIDGKCNSFDVTLSPHQNIMRNVPVTGTAASPKYAIDISDAEFVKSAQEKGDNLGSLRGQVEHIKSLISQAQDQQKKQVECLAQLGSLDKTGYLEQGSIKAIASGIREGRDSASMSSQQATNTAKVSTLVRQELRSSLRAFTDAATNAKQQVTISRDDVKSVSDKQKADELLEQAKQMEQVTDQFKKFAEYIAAAEEPTTILKIAMDAYALSKQIDLDKKVRTLLDEANKIDAKNVVLKYRLAVGTVKTLQNRVNDLVEEVKQAEENAGRSLKTAETAFDQDRKGKGGFQFEKLQTCISLAHKARLLAGEALTSGTSLLERTAAAGAMALPGNPASEKAFLDMKTAVGGYIAIAKDIRYSGTEDLERMEKLVEAARKAM